ncbi:UDP-N-acetylmuramoyl-L-alanyl-D-glutamate--2,6-diaminopimelate ligase [Peribacillus saganii]|uniref:UDP-N-acetylmuramyl-tripeptide synthetase n=1 Tax=Peribacillus saganii TaxID=2303992 RepID=A0A372LTU4_9BACI|nr:UDP-N-acetylmuramoyl-L-alanyl-D-glutamate--2,6-diaminopimelate ligase [Peribacillus saganii]RFU70974.1 UDP-N-acetylmuramoyl-L-alanyl-D-glutamate--2,6-diaminopimelate ligase [Peribacillus saganii]
MELSNLIYCLHDCTETIPSIPNRLISGIEINSQKVREGYIFVAINGYSTDGHNFINDAIEKGASLIIGEKKLNPPVPYIKVNDSRKAAAKLASTFYGNPSRKHKIIGITGTNGKTTVSYMLRHILNSAGLSCSLLGTVSYIINGEHHQSTHTTPDAVQLQKLLAESNDEFVVLEISSHALEQSRVENLEVDLALFTNLSHEHLDYHHSMENYFASKSKLFQYLKQDGKAVINRLDVWGEKLARRLKEELANVITVGRLKDDHLVIDKINVKNKTECSLLDHEGNYSMSLPFPGEHNVYNASMAFATAKQLGIPAVNIIQALESFPGVPGRFEMFPHPAGATFVVDYAHTEDAIEYCLKTAKNLGAEQVTHIFGFRGDRDTTKREHMVQASARNSDRRILTLDDLNGVPQEEMIEQLEALCRVIDSENSEIIYDRTLAIRKAWKTASPGEWVLVTGKGREPYKQAFTLPSLSDKDTLSFLFSETGQGNEPIEGSTADNHQTG